MQQISQGPVMGFPGNPPYPFNQIIPFAYITAAELKMRGINEQFIAHVEEKRPHLQRFIEQHQEMKSVGGGAGAVNDTPGLGMGLSRLPGMQPQQAHQMALNAPQQMNPNVRRDPGAAPKPTEGTGIGLDMSTIGVNAMFVQRTKEYMT